MTVYGASTAENIVLVDTSLEIYIPVHVTIIHLGCAIRPLVADLLPCRCGFDSGPVACTVKHTREEILAFEYGDESLGTVLCKEFVCLVEQLLDAEERLSFMEELRYTIAN